jgi:hypothetical protein
MNRLVKWIKFRYFKFLQKLCKHPFKIVQYRTCKIHGANVLTERVTCKQCKKVLSIINKPCD